MMEIKAQNQDRREWIAIVLLLLLGGVCLFMAAQAATALPPRWSAPANMYSRLDPNDAYATPWPVMVEPIRPEIMTPPTRKLGQLLTPDARATDIVVSPVSFAPTRTRTPVPTPAATQPPARPTVAPPPVQSTPTPAQPTAPPTSTPLPTQPPASPTPTPSPTLLLPTATQPPLPTKGPKPTREPRPTKVP